MQPCLVVWGCAWVSLMFCLEPDWAWPDCTASKQLEGYFGVWEPSQGAGGVPLVHGRIDREGRREKALARSMDGTRIDKGSDALTSHNHLFATVHTLLLSVSHLVFIKQIHTCRNTRWQESTAVSSQLSDTASIDLKFTGESGGTHWRLQSNLQTMYQWK